MTPAAKCKRLATMLRAKAELERDPEIRAEWKCIARGYLILATLRERYTCLLLTQSGHFLFSGRMNPSLELQYQSRPVAFRT